MSRLDELGYVNALVNRDRYVPDPDGDDDWRPDATPTGRDCDSYATQKAVELYRRGWSPKDMRLACLYVEDLGPVRYEDLTPMERYFVDNGGATLEQVAKWRRYHAVLIVTVDGQDWMLDNRQRRIVRVTELAGLGYEPSIIEDVNSPTGWSEWKGVV